MPDFNLTTSDSQQSSGLISKSLLVSILILGFTLLLYAALLGGNSYLSSQIDEVQTEYTGEYNKLLSNNAKDVIDFYYRMQVAQDLLGKEKNMYEGMTEVEKLMVPGSYLNSLAYASPTNSFSVEYASDNYNSVAKQLLGFKGSKYFQQVSGGESAMSQAALSDQSNKTILTKATLKLK